MTNDVYKVIKASTLIVIIGSLLSGPIVSGIAAFVSPQPEWIDANVYLEYYHWIQSLPIIFGFVFLLGNCLFIVSVIRLAKTEMEKIFANLAIVMVTIYAVIVSLNYIIQVGYMKPIEGISETVITILSMRNPFSLAWVFEMTGYAFLGIAFWLTVPLFKEKLIKILLAFNGIISIAGAIVTCVDLSYPLSFYGIISYICWNILIIFIMWMIFSKFAKLSSTAKN
jgi:hypothetical protein